MEDCSISGGKPDTGLTEAAERYRMLELSLDRKVDMHVATNLRTSVSNGMVLHQNLTVYRWVMRTGSSSRLAARSRLCNKHWETRRLSVFRLVLTLILISLQVKGLKDLVDLVHKGDGEIKSDLTSSVDKLRLDVS